MIWKECSSHTTNPELIATAIQSGRVGHPLVQHTFYSFIGKKNNFACSYLCDCSLPPSIYQDCFGFQTRWKQFEVVPRDGYLHLKFSSTWSSLGICGCRPGNSQQSKTQCFVFTKEPLFGEKDGFFSSQSCPTEAFREAFLVNFSEQERPMLLCTWWMGRPVHSSVSPTEMGYLISGW